MDRRIILVEGFFEGVGPDPVKFAETLANKSIERRVEPFLGTTFNDHVDELNLLDRTKLVFRLATDPKKKGADFLALLQLNFEQLVNSFFVVERSRLSNK
jgi:hypothetical protein